MFARPGVRVVKPKGEDEITQQPIPWTSLKNEWNIYQRVQDSSRKKPGTKFSKKTGTNKDQVQPKAKPPAQAEEEASSEEDDADDDDEDEEQKQPGPPPAEDDASSEEEEDDNPESRSRVNLPAILAKVTGKSEAKNPAPKSESLPLAFYGQQNHDDDEKDYLKEEKNIFKKKKNVKEIDSKEDEESKEDDDVSDSNEAASPEDYADYAVDEDDADGENGDDSKNVKSKGKTPNEMSFEDIPLAIREMILNDLANQNNGTGYVPNLTPQVTGNRPSSTENDDSAENSSEEDDNNVAAVPNRDIANPNPTPPASTKNKKGEDEDVRDDDRSRGGKKGKGKKKKKGKKGGWGWKPTGWGNIHIAPGWGHHHHEDKGWGWGEKHDGLLEQLVKGSTWERVLHYYHWRRDQAVKEDGHHGHHDHHDHHHHDNNHPGLEWSPFDPHPQIDEHGWGWKKQGTVKKAVKKAFKGSFWERAFHTYSKYKENQAKHPRKPALIDLDSDGVDMKIGR